VDHFGVGEFPTPGCVLGFACHAKIANFPVEQVWGEQQFGCISVISLMTRWVSALMAMGSVTAIATFVHAAN
jgi:hypothetical protein